MNRKMLSTLIMAATMAIGGIGATQINNNKTSHRNEVLLSRNVGVKTNEAVVINGDNNLVLRATPRKNGKCISYISVGEMLTIEGTSGNYYKVKVQETDSTGYISMNDTQIIVDGEEQALEEMNSKGTVINVTTKLNLRANAGINSTIINKLNEGTNFNILGKEGQWYKVNVNGEIGFIYEEYVGLNENVVVGSNNIPKGISSSAPGPVIISNNSGIPLQKGIGSTSGTTLGQPSSSTGTTSGTTPSKISTGTGTTSGTTSGQTGSGTGSTSGTTSGQPSSSTGTTSGITSSKTSTGTGSTSGTTSGQPSSSTGTTSGTTPSKTSTGTGTTSGTTSGQTGSGTGSTSGTTSGQPSSSTGTTSGITSSKTSTGTGSTSGTTSGQPSSSTGTTSGTTPSKTSTGTGSTSGTTSGQPSSSTGTISGTTPSKTSTGTGSTSGTTSGQASSSTGTTSGTTPSKTSTGTGTTSGTTSGQPSSSTGSTSGTTNQETPSQLKTYDAEVVTPDSTVNVMSDPSLETDYSYVVGTLNNGAAVNVISIDNGWYEIEFGDGVGYINSDDLNVDGQTIPTSTSVANSTNTINKDVTYDATMKEYVAGELTEYDKANGGSLTETQLENATTEISNAVNPQAAATVFEFLNVNQYRNVDAQEFNEALQGKGIFQGQGEAFLNAAKEYNLDPVYLMAQSAEETGWGTSSFAQGSTITEVADMNDPIYNSQKQLIGYKMIQLAKPVTVYNLFGIGADNNTSEFPDEATISAEAYAYNHGWTSISSAIMGAAEFLSTNYINNTNIAQNTPYELRYIDGTDGDMWHQYNSDINYGEQIGEIMQQYSYLYNSDDTFTFGIPTFENN